ncbi:DUF4179 domain-containing protein [Alkalibacillus haloalkaliphilus]|uniref:DUF4179 domain-containing protein n=1 Tax=Alkalibacillus haloalkaliphilus TaxID=94136 RepID=A0A511W2N5_9BACI|nr:DUF4179 domain-containing protein [Alkalibacillus haloalkaliphilus]GEN45345.1 hypothetical protein AHA02nite_11210 [Alkalibacillus haloalkaliphilus]
MDRNTEKRVEKWAESYQETTVSDELLKETIDEGFKQNLKRKKRTVRNWRSAIAAIIFAFTFIVGVNTSPVFAEQVGKIPGFEHIVELVKWDKGRQAALSHGHFEEIGRTVSHGEVDLTIDGVIRDQYGLVIYHTIETEQPYEQLRLTDVEINSADGEDLPIATLSFGMPSQQDVTTYTEDSEVFFSEPVEQTEFVLKGKVKAEGGLEKEFKVSFEADHQPDPVHYDVNESFKVGTDDYMISEVMVNPLRTEVVVQIPDDSEWALLRFEDLRLLNENGVAWARIQNGVTGSGNWHSNEDGTFSVFLQSNYFETYEELTLALDKMQAVPVDNTYLELDLESEEIVHDPLGAFEKVERYSKSGYRLYLEGDEFRFGPFGQVYDNKGNEISSSSHSYSRDDQMQVLTHSLDDNVTPEMNPIRVNMVFYPNWINEPTQIDLN